MKKIHFVLLMLFIFLLSFFHTFSNSDLNYFEAVIVAILPFILIIMVEGFSILRKKLKKLKKTWNI
jgi:hypothetical protein